MTDVGGIWYMIKSAKILPPINKSKLSKNHKRSKKKLKNYMKLISGVMIGHSNCIGTSLNGWIQKISQKGINPIHFLQKRFT